MKDLESLKHDIERLKNDSMQNSFAYFDFQDYSSIVDALQSFAGEGIIVKAERYGLYVERVRDKKKGGRKNG